VNFQCAGYGGSGRQFSGFDLVDITPDPSFAGLDGADQWMLCVMEMFSGMFIFRGITASDVTAYKTHAEMDPLIAHLHAFFADVGLGFADFDLVEV
jgi:hypothetical protein